MTVSRHESPTGSISQVTLEVPSALTSSLHSALKLWTSRRGGSTSRFSPSAMSIDPGDRGLVARAGRPVRAGLDPEAVLRPHLGVGDRLPEALRRRLDVDLEHDLSAIQIVCPPRSSFLSPLSVAAQGSAYLLTHRSWTSRIGTGFRKWSFSRPRRLRGHEARLLEHPQVLHDAEARHRQPPLERAQRLPVLLEQLVEQAPARRVGEGLEHRVHAGIIGDHLVTCQGRR